MDKDIGGERKYSYKRKIITWHVFSILSGLLVFGLYLYYSESIIDGVYHLYYFIIIVLAGVAYLYERFAPGELFFDTEVIRCGKNKIGWKDVEEVYFSSIAWEFTNPFIRIVPKEGKPFNINPKRYSKSKEIREAFESLCKEKSIRCHVNERGLY